MSFVRPRGTPAGLAQQDGKRQKKEEKVPYMSSHFTRAVLLAMDESFWHIRWEQLPWTMATILRWTPDATDQCLPITEMLLTDVVKKFGCSPLWVSCWACFASRLSVDELGLAMRSTDRDLQKAATTWVRKNNSACSLEEDPDQFSPVVRDLLEQLRMLAQQQEDAKTTKANAKRGKRQKIENTQRLVGVSVAHARHGASHVIVSGKTKTRF